MLVDFDAMIQRLCRGVPLKRVAMMGSCADVVANTSQPLTCGQVSERLEKILEPSWLLLRE